MKHLLLFFLLFATSTFAELRWNWSNINLSNLKFPPSFLWGCSDSALQTEGMESCGGLMVENSWTEFETVKSKSVRVGKSCERWTRFKDDIKLLNQIGMNAYRFSIEWSKIEPREGFFDDNALNHYLEQIDFLNECEIEPIVTLFHHTVPVWFARKGGFANQQNNYYFIRFARFVFEHVHTKIKKIIILNEPVAYAIEAYWRGNYPPALHNLKKAGKVAKNLLKLHVDTAESFRSINPRIQIGIAHVMNPLDAYHRWNFLEHGICKFFNYLVNDSTINFFKTGTFKWFRLKNYKNKAALKSIDFFGINYYSHTLIRQKNLFSIGPTVRSAEMKVGSATNGRSDKVIYAEGLYRSICKASELDKPLYITENGASSNYPKAREEYIKKHLYAVSWALQEGYDIQGYFFWTLVDCFSWNNGYEPRHGIFEVDFTTQKRTLRASSQPLLDIIARHA